MVTFNSLCYQQKGKKIIIHVWTSHSRDSLIFLMKFESIQDTPHQSQQQIFNSEQDRRCVVWALVELAVYWGYRQVKRQWHHCWTGTRTGEERALQGTPGKRIIREIFLGKVTSKHRPKGGDSDLGREKQECELFKEPEEALDEWMSKGRAE